jgi:hypothetical protein
MKVTMDAFKAFAFSNATVDSSESPASRRISPYLYIDLATLGALSKLFSNISIAFLIFTLCTHVSN